MLLPRRYLRPKLRSGPASPRSPRTSRSLFEADVPVKVHMSPTPVDPRLRLDLTALRKKRRIPLIAGQRGQSGVLLDKEKASLVLPSKLIKARSEPGLQGRKRIASLTDFAGQQAEAKRQEKGSRENEGRPAIRNEAKRTKNRRTASYPSHIYLNFICPLIPRFPFSFCPR